MDTAWTQHLMNVTLIVKSAGEDDTVIVGSGGANQYCLWRDKCHLDCQERVPWKACGDEHA